MMPSSHSPLSKIADEPGRTDVSVTLPDLELAFRGLKQGDAISAHQHALLDQFFRQGLPQRNACVAEFVGTAVAVHVPSPCFPDDIASLSPLYADAGGRVYRYDGDARKLILLLAPTGVAA